MDKRLEQSGRKISHPFDIEWPRLSEEVDSKILANLDIIFGKYKACLRSVKKKRPLQEQSTHVDALTEEEIEQRKQFKSQFVVGVNEVLKGLEKNELCLVLVSRTAQPPLLMQTILGLVVSRQCPAACVSDLQTTVHQPWPGLTSLTTMGIKKMEVLKDFGDLVQYVNSVVPSLDVPELPQAAQNDIDDDDATTTPSSRPTDVDQTSSDTVSQSKSVPGCGMTIDSLPEIDPTKYYVYKSDTNTQKSFRGQDFIEFDKNDNDAIHISVVNGKIPESHNLIHDRLLFGIAPPFYMDTCKTEIKTDEVRGTKRSAGSSSYKGFTVKQAKRDPTSQKKKKKTKVSSHFTKKKAS